MRTISRSGSFRFAFQALFERFAGHELHDDVRQAVVARLFHLMHRHDVLVRYRRRRAGFAAEPLPGDLVVGQIRVEHLERHVALQPRIERFEHQAHAAAAQDSHHVEMRQPPEIGAVGGRLQEIE